jgi:hypothetical protein
MEAYPGWHSYVSSAVFVKLFSNMIYSLISLRIFIFHSSNMTSPAVSFVFYPINSIHKFLRLLLRICVIRHLKLIFIYFGLFKSPFHQYALRTLFFKLELSFYQLFSLHILSAYTLCWICNYTTLY